MNSALQNLTLSQKIAALVEEKGWNQEEFARYAGLNRQTIRQILQDGQRTLRNSTVRRCAEALGLSVNELRILPIEQLLKKIRDRERPPETSGLRLLERATQPELIAWVQRNPERAAELTPDEVEELLDLQQESGGPFASFGVEHFVELIERKRKLIEQIHTIAGTEYIDLLEQLVGLIYEKVQPYKDRR